MLSMSRERAFRPRVYLVGTRPGESRSQVGDGKRHREVLRGAELPEKPSELPKDMRQYPTNSKGGEEPGLGDPGTDHPGEGMPPGTTLLEEGEETAQDTAWVAGLV